MLCPDCQVGVLVKVIVTEDESSHDAYYCPFCEDIIPGDWDEKAIEQWRRLLADEL